MCLPVLNCIHVRMEKKFVGITRQFELALYLTNSLSEAIFTGGGNKGITVTTIYPACWMPFKVRLALAPAMASYLCNELQMVAFIVRFQLFINRNFFKHVLYVWFVYHCNGLHSLGAQNVEKPFFAFVASGRSISFTVEEAGRHLSDFQNSRIYGNPPPNTSHWDPKAHEGVLSESNVDLCNPRTGRSFRLTEMEKEWLLIIRPTDFVFRRGNVINIQAYAPSQFVVQIGFAQGVVGSPGYIRHRYNSLQEAINA